MAETTAVVRCKLESNRFLITDGKIIVTILYEGDGPMAYVYDKNYKKVRINSKFAYEIIEDGRAVKISPAEFDAMKNIPAIDDGQSARELKKIIDMAMRIKKQFANAAVTEDGKYFFYVNLEFVRLDGSTPNWKPEARIIAEDLSTPRVSWDIVEREVIPQNVFVEIKKDDVEIARRIAKTNGIDSAFDYLNSRR